MEGFREVGEQSPEAIWSRREEPLQEEANRPRSRVMERMSGRYLNTIYQALTGNEGNSRDLHPSCLSVNVFSSPFLLMWFLFVGENIYNCCHTPGLPLSYPALTPQPGVCLVEM